MNDYIKVEFEFLSNDQKEMLVALLAEVDYEGFEEEGDLLKAYIPTSKFDEEVLQALVKKYNLSFSKSEIENKNWNQLWESNFQPVIINHPLSNTPWIAIRAHFHQPLNVGEFEIIITPKMSFGTGHHATTAMMIKMMSEIVFRGKTVLDFGTGTGILAIVAEKLGASKVVAIDNDDQSIKNATENFLLNNCGKIELVKASSAQRIETFDIILANIIKKVIRENFSKFVNELSPNGLLIMSGLLKDDEPEILEAAQQEYNVVLEAKFEAENWICLKMRRDGGEQIIVIKNGE